jgi:hypothetical protein
MWAFGRRHKGLVRAALLALTLLLSACLWAVSGAVRGRIAAQYDIARGHYYFVGLRLTSPFST